jgi:hypothetical protein
MDPTERAPTGAWGVQEKKRCKKRRKQPEGLLATASWLQLPRAQQLPQKKGGGEEKQENLFKTQDVKIIKKT